MTVKELIDHLSKIPPDMPVLTIDTCSCCTEKHDLTVEDITVLPKGYKWLLDDKLIGTKSIIIGASSLYADEVEGQEEYKIRNER